MVSYVKQYILDLINDRRQDPISQVVKFHLLIFSHIYAFLVMCHHFFYKVNLLKSYKPDIAALSVGNITLGGTGKTPFVIMLTECLFQNKLNPGILIRGYGEDEYKMLQDRLGQYGVKVFVGRDRVKSAKKAVENHIETLILDDGFQHRRLRRDLDIVLVDSTNPFGNNYLFPRGILREPVSSLRRADIIVLTKVDKPRPFEKGRDKPSPWTQGLGKGEGSTSSIEDEIERIAPGKKIIKAWHKPKNLFDVWKNKIIELTYVNGKTVCILSAICDPSYFRHTVEQTGASIDLEFVFPDHYQYRNCDLNRILNECERKKIETIVTTEKDAVKLKKLSSLGSRTNFQILALRIELKITQREELDAEIHRLHMRHSVKDI